ncbi:beta-1,3-galactosyltransferase 1-like [Oculina patagonica]
MHRKLKYGIVLLQWKTMSLTRRELHIIGIIAAASITSLVAGLHYTPSYPLATKHPTFSRNFSPHHDCKSWKTTPQHKTTLITRTTCVRNYFLLILVSSAPANFERRHFIRQTWGADNNTAPQWKTYFLLGQSRNQTLSGLLQTENNNFGDMIRADYYEHYWNQSLKMQMGLEWAARYCNFSFLIKADDDVLVDTKSLINFLRKTSTPKQGLYMGKVHHRDKVPRAGKWGVPYEEYNHTHYPDFCTGAGIVMSPDVIDCLVPLFDVIKPYRMDDVYVGMLANKGGVKAVHHNAFFVHWDDDDCIFRPNTFMQHRATGQCLIKLHRMHSHGVLYYRTLGSYF